jgi:hypothetical protein
VESRREKKDRKEERGGRTASTTKRQPSQSSFVFRGFCTSTSRGRREMDLPQDEDRRDGEERELKRKMVVVSYRLFASLCGGKTGEEEEQLT